jgi:hypothetical protein
LNGANAAFDPLVDLELPAYQGFSADCSTVAGSGRLPSPMAALVAPAKLKKILAGHGVSGVS